ncbi:MAG: class II aldolase/adducin family protein [Treponema sp.]|jgi:rhamnose utilization protein RhaD (predicted bifunctional aldolase and dehydrogenase)|nr:class II aldolase/adducin family protein [Treponema sp.]
MSVDNLVAISRLYGSNPEYIVAGGGNTSFKDEKTLYIKESGTSLADCTADTFVKMDRTVLAKIWENTYPEDPDKRESAVLEDMMSAKMAGEEHKRPSVETLLHDLLPFAYVVHTHPALINGLTCSKEGEKAAERIFGGNAGNVNIALWIPSVNPGYILSLTVKKAMADYAAKKGKAPSIILLQNHGVFVGANTTEEINLIYKNIADNINAYIKHKPNLSGEVSGWKTSCATFPVLKDLAESAGDGERFVSFRRNAGIISVVENRSAFAPVSSALSPDHIVYAGSDPLFVETNTENLDQISSDIKTAWDNHLTTFGKAPKTVAIQGLGVFGIGTSEKAAGLALDLFCDAIKVAVYAEAFGGVQFMPKHQIDFINNWEVERYRTNVSVGK